MQNIKEILIDLKTIAFNDVLFSLEPCYKKLISTWDRNSASDKDEDSG